MKYRVLYGSSMSELETEVNDYLSRDWKPQGGMFYRVAGFKDIYYQAMVKEKD